MILRRWYTSLTLLAVALAVSPSLAQEGRWSVALGPTYVGDPDDPYEGETAPEIDVWVVLTDRLDLGLRVGQFKFDSMGATASDEQFLLPGEATLVPLELGARFYPRGSDRAWFPFVGATIVVPVSDDFDADPTAPVPPGLGLSFATELDVDSVGFGLEGGVRWDISERWFLDGALRYVLLGAESRGLVELSPGVTADSIVETNFDALRVALHVGIYF
ncbi:MAG: hypothetical protein JSV80_06745 [Acidobacteriota bacterium]|nr:MAG: hypothetical protein JSV80_06745 [Acidobacteriota bacterium]